MLLTCSHMLLQLLVTDGTNPSCSTQRVCVLTAVLLCHCCQSKTGAVIDVVGELSKRSPDACRQLLRCLQATRMFQFRRAIARMSSTCDCLPQEPMNRLALLPASALGPAHPCLRSRFRAARTHDTAQIEADTFTEPGGDREEAPGPGRATQLLPVAANDLASMAVLQGAAVLFPSVLRAPEIGHLPTEGK
jgi:hypothetical protein